MHSKSLMRLVLAYFFCSQLPLVGFFTLAWIYHKSHVFPFFCQVHLCRLCALYTRLSPDRTDTHQKNVSHLANENIYSSGKFFSYYGCLGQYNQNCTLGTSVFAFSDASKYSVFSTPALPQKNDPKNSCTCQATVGPVEICWFWNDCYLKIE